FGRGREHHIDVRRDAHAVEILLPFAGANRVVHHHDEADVERLSPAHDHLTVNQTVIDAVELDAHAAGVRIALLPASAARRAASSGGRSRWNTKSSSIARLTPVTTATFVLPLASRMELVRQEPPGRSTNSTAGCSAIAAVTRAVNAPESQPSLLTGTRASSTPVIAATAAFNACATAACETITPRSGSLIVLLEVLLQLALLRHPLEQPLVEMLRRVLAAVAHQVAHRHALALADPGATKEEQDHAEHVGERGVYRGSRREGVVEERLQAPVELGGLELRADHGDALVARELQQLGRRVLRLRDDDARQVEPEEGLERRAALGGAERGEVGDLRLSQQVDAMRSEALGVACEREARARRLRRRDEAVEAYVPRQGLELQGIALALKQVAHPGSGHRGSRPTARRAAATR